MATPEELRALSGTLDENAVARLQQALENAATTIESLQQRIGELERLLKDCADELTQWVEHHYAPTKDYPSEMRRYERDIEPAREAHRVLSGER